MQKLLISVGHEKLILKLRHVGIEGLSLLWISAFLKNRTQSVKIKNSLSDQLSVSSGVPQGSVLGPTLFNIFINDLVDYIEYSDIYLFADDVKLFSENPTQLQSDLLNFTEWAYKWQLEISVKKCCVLHLGSNYPNVDYSLGNTVLSSERIVKDLGLHISDKLSFTSHCNALFQKCSRISSLICKTFLSKDLNLKLKAFKAYVVPILDYCSSIYNPYKISDIKLIERIQRKFTKQILWHENLTYENRLQRLNLQPLEVRRIMFDLSLFYKIIKNQIPGFSENFKIKDSKTITRSSCKTIIDIPKHRLDIMKYSFFIRTAKIWNSLPFSVTQSRSIKAFQKSLATVDLSPYTRGATKCSFQPSRTHDVAMTI